VVYTQHLVRRGLEFPCCRDSCFQSLGGSSPHYSIDHLLQLCPQADVPCWCVQFWACGWFFPYIVIYTAIGYSCGSLFWTSFLPGPQGFPNALRNVGLHLCLYNCCTHTPVVSTLQIPLRFTVVPFSEAAEPQVGSLEHDGVTTKEHYTRMQWAGQWWCTPLIPALERQRQRQADFWVRGQPGLQSEFQDSQSYTEKSCLEKPKRKKKKKGSNPPLPLVRQWQHSASTDVIPKYSAYPWLQFAFAS
jgi:hypothetical protein